MFSEEKKMFPTQAYRPRIEYMPARLTRGKSWYISFYAYDPETDALRRCRVKINRIRDKNERRTAAAAMIREINQQLHNGWSPFIKHACARSHELLFEILDRFQRQKAKELEPNSVRSYNSYLKTLRTWLDSRGYGPGTYIRSFDRNMAAALMLDIDMNPRISPRTYNNYLRFFRNLGNWMIQYNYISENPFSQIRKKERRLTRKIRRTLTDTEKRQLFDFLVERERYDYLAMCLLCYYCLMRDKEILSLRVRDISIKKQLVRVGEDIAKNDHTSWRTIPDEMVPWLLKLDLCAPGDCYLFSPGKDYTFVPGPERACERRIGRYWSDVIRPALGWGLDLQFYSLKDTGITDMATAGVPLNLVKEQADHSSLEMTGIYMGDSGGKAHESIKKISTFLQKSEK